jgi:hypothetical protein
VTLGVKALNEFQIGVKSYDLDWFVKYDLSYQEAAQMLSDWGVGFVLAQNQYLPMPDSAVKSQVTPEMAARLVHYDDRAFRDALAAEGIEYWATVCMFFDPTALGKNPSLRPIGSDGHRQQKVGWYEGIAPSEKGFVENRIRDLEKATRALEPDGLFLSFMRWPGFWELWLPRHSRQDFVEYSFDANTLDRFVRASGANLQTRQARQAAVWIEANAGQVWADWKCGVVDEVVRQVRQACCDIKPDLEIMLNTLPFGSGDFDNARERVFGQRIETLARDVDCFEVMTYHQILKREIGWIEEQGAKVRDRSGRRTVCTLQTRPLYLDGMYARAGRSPDLDEDDFELAVRAVEDAGLDGAVVFTWADLLEDVLEHDNTSRVDSLQGAAARRRKRLASIGEAG